MNPIDSLRKRASALPSSEKGSTPASRTVPPLGESSVPRMFNNVDFPDPLGPTTASRSPGESMRSTPRNTTNASPGVGYSFRNSETTKSPFAIGDGSYDPVARDDNRSARVNTPGQSAVELRDPSAVPDPSAHENRSSF